MNKRELLINTIVLQYRDIERGNRNNGIAEWVLENIAESEVVMGASAVKDTVKELKDVVRYLCDIDKETPVDRKALINKLKLATQGEEYILEIIEGDLVELSDPQEINKESVRLRKLLSEYRRQVETIEVIQQTAKDIHFKPDVNARQLAIDLLDKLHPLVDGTTYEVEGLIQEMDLDDTKALSDTIEKGKETSSTDGIIKTGWKGLNRMCGEEGGLRRGDLVCIGALQHNFKSGKLLGIAKHTALYNKPFMINPDAKPLIVHISLENNVEDNTLLLYRSLKENETGVAVQTQAINIEEAAAYIKERMSVNGYHFKMLRAEPGTFGVRNLIDTLSNFITEGYELHVVVIDYLNLFGKQGCYGGNDSAMIRDLFRKVRAFCNPRLITCVTAHQLSPEAKLLLREGGSNFTQTVAGKGYWDSCRSIDQELDLEIIIHIEKLNGFSYLDVARGKHRKSTITPEAALHYCQQFHEIGSLLDDINLPTREWLPNLPRQDGGSDGGSWF